MSETHYHSTGEVCSECTSPVRVKKQEEASSIAEERAVPLSEAGTSRFTGPRCAHIIYRDSKRIDGDFCGNSSDASGYCWLHKTDPTLVPAEPTGTCAWPSCLAEHDHEQKIEQIIAFLPPSLSRLKKEVNELEALVREVQGERSELIDAWATRSVKLERKNKELRELLGQAVEALDSSRLMVLLLHCKNEAEERASDEVCERVAGVRAKAKELMEKS